jgi:hypothetical protein
MTDLITSDSATLAAQLQATADRAMDYRAKAKAANTIAAYRADWNAFMCWCHTRTLESLPASPATVTLYITDLAERCKPSTITGHLATISQAHQQAGHATPTTAQCRAAAGVRRLYDSAGTPVRLALGASHLLPHLFAESQRFDRIASRRITRTLRSDTTGCRASSVMKVKLGATNP